MIYLICGQKGTGKSLFTISLLNKLKNEYSYIYSNFPVKFCRKLDHYDWVNFRFYPNSAILIDEAQLYFNSREFSKLTKNGIGMQLLDYLTMCRHYQVDIYFITQSSNRIDLQIRELADYVYYLKRTFKIPFLKRPFFIMGYKFPDIMEFEKFTNPNNFSREFNFRWLFKFIRKKDLNQYDTYHIEQTYYDKNLIINEPWSVETTVGSTPSINIFSLIKIKIKLLFLKFKNIFFIKKDRINNSLENETKYF